MAATLRISVEKGIQFKLDIAMFTGTVGERRIQSTVPTTTLRVSHPDICSVSLATGPDNIPELFVEALENGACDISLTAGNGPIINYRITVEPTSVVRWLPKTLEVGTPTTAITPPPVDPFPPGSVDGPNGATAGAPYWLQRTNNNRWFIWWDVDTDPGPDVKKRLSVFLADENVNPNYRNEVAQRAAQLGYPT